MKKSKIKRVAKHKVKGAGLGVRSLGTILLLTGVGTVAGVAFVIISLFLNELSAFESVVNQSKLNRYQAQIQTQFRAENRRAEILAGDPELVKLLQRGTLQMLVATEGALRARYPEAARIRILRPGVDVVDKGSIPNLGYADLEQLRYVEKHGKSPDLEVYSFNSENQHYNRMWPIYTATQQLVGVLLFQYKTDRLLGQLEQIGQIDGRLELVQGRGEKALRLAAVGNQNDSQALSASIDGTRWMIRYFGVPLSAGDYEERLSLLVGIPAGGGLLFFVIGFVIMRRIATAMRRDQAAMLHLVKDIINRKTQTNYPIQLPDFKDMRDVLLEMGRERTVALRPKRSTAEMARRAAETSATQAVMEVEEISDKQVAAEMSDTIFRAYDIRGIVGDTLTPEVVYEIGRAFGSEAYERGQQSVVVGRDGRISSQEFSEALCRGLQATGRDVIDVGMVPTPVLYFATEHLRTGTGIMVTGSHNSAEYNGLKMVLRGEAISGELIQGLRKRIISGNMLRGQGKRRDVDALSDYLVRLASGIKPTRKLKVVVDCGNGVAGVIAEKLFQGLGCDVTLLYCDVDGSFPNHHPDPAVPENMRALIEAVTSSGAHLGLAFDGDADRLGVVDGQGNIIWPDRQMMLFAQDVLRDNAGATVIYDVKCSRHLPKVIQDNGGVPLMWKTGHSLIKSKMKETGAILGGEMSGHLVVRDRWYGFDDALYAAARMIEMLANDAQGREPQDILSSLPNSEATPELRVEMEEGEPQKFMEQLLATPDVAEGEVSLIDGLRVDFPEGFGLVRASNTSPCLVLRFEADDEHELSRIQDIFRLKLYAIDPNLDLPF